MYPPSHGGIPRRVMSGRLSSLVGLCDLCIITKYTPPIRYAGKEFAQNFGENSTVNFFPSISLPTSSCRFLMVKLLLDTTKKIFTAAYDTNLFSVGSANAVFFFVLFLLCPYDRHRIRIVKLCNLTNLNFRNRGRCSHFF